MNKQQALDQLGGTVSSAAKAIGITPSAVTQWPDGELPSRIADRVQAALTRMREAKKRSKKPAEQVSPVSTGA